MSEFPNLIHWLVGAAHNLGDWLRPAVNYGLWALTVFGLSLAVLLVLARFGALVVGPNSKWTMSERWWFWYTTAGLSLLLIASTFWAVVSTTGSTQPSHEILVVFAVICAAVGMTLFARGLGHRFRVQVNVVGRDGKLDPLGASFVAARMEAMGTNRPRGLYFAHGPDAANLPESALSTVDTTQSKFAAAILGMLRGMASITPWKVTVVLVDPGTATVTLTRNGRRVDSELVATSVLLPSAQASEAEKKRELADRALLTACAAFLLFRLSKTYPRLSAGLGGTTRWQSLAWQTLASSAPWSSDPEVSTELFARAVNEDPENRSAWLGFLVKQSGSFGSMQSIISLCERLNWLWDSVQLIQGNEESEIALRIRLLRILTLAYTNRLLFLPNDGEFEETIENAVRSAALFVDEVDKASRSTSRQPLLQEYVERMRPLAGSLYLHVLNMQDKVTSRAVGKQAATGVGPKESRGDWAGDQRSRKVRRELAASWVPSDKALGSLKFEYDRACDLLEEDPTGIDAALPHLELALGLKELRENAVSDPSFKPLRKDRRFAALLDDRAKIESLSALRMHAEKLAADGIRFASEFITRNSEHGDEHLATSLGVPLETVIWMRGICELEQHCPEPRLAIEWTNLLTEEGIDSIESLNTFLRSPKDHIRDVLARMSRKAGTSSIDGPQFENLRQWADGDESIRIPVHWK